MPLSQRYKGRTKGQNSSLSKSFKQGMYGIRKCLMRTLFYLSETQRERNNLFLYSHCVARVAGQVCRRRPSFTSLTTPYSWRKYFFRKLFLQKKFSKHNTYFIIVFIFSFNHTIGNIAYFHITGNLLYKIML